VTAPFQGAENAGWTNEKTRTFLIGSMSDVWEAFIREHHADGRHGEAVIRAENILLGVSRDALKGSLISVGENVNAGDLSLSAAKTLFEALAAIGQILQGGTANTLLKKLSMLVSWKSAEVYQPFTPTFFQGRIYYANPINLPSTGESPGNAPSKWINAAGDVVYLPPLDGRIYVMRNRLWSELGIGGDSVEALKFHSGKSLTLTNAGTAYRRLKGGDLGLAYLSDSHEVYHFDTDNLSQNQQGNVVISYQGMSLCAWDGMTPRMNCISSPPCPILYLMNPEENHSTGFFPRPDRLPRKIPRLSFGCAFLYRKIPRYSVWERRHRSLSRSVSAARIPGILPYLTVIYPTARRTV
jgi:hypothetical protein